MNYKDRWGLVRDARKAQKKAKKARRKLLGCRTATTQQKNSWKAILARNMRFNPTRHEAIMYDALKENGFSFDTQVQVGPYIVDALIREGKTVIEVDGLIHESQKEYDLERDRYLWNRSYRVIRFKNSEVACDLSGVIKRLREFRGEIQ